MCLITNQKEPIIANKAITVWKYLENMRAPYNMDFIYEVGKEYKTTFKAGDVSSFDDKDGLYLDQNFPDWSLRKNFKSIGQGFHSFLTLDRALPYKCCGQIWECTIPKGAEYYKGFTDLIVSSKIIIKKLYEQEESTTKNRQKKKTGMFV